jgi:hypothetical protein
MELPGDATVKPGLANPALQRPARFPPAALQQIAVTISSSFDVQGGVGLILRPERAIDVLVGFGGRQHADFRPGSLSVRAEYSDESQQPTVLLGATESTRLEF